jgi:HD-GYP domain-containing protein (c-di-GMP phosphodiesterase class II)
MSQLDISCFYNPEEVVSKHDTIPNHKYFNYVKVIKGVFNDLVLSKKLNYIKILDLSEEIFSEINESPNFNQVFNNFYSIDDSINTAIYSMYIGKWLGLPFSQLKKVVQSGLLHDIGKSKIPNEVLNKKGPLNKEEVQIIQKYSFYGYEIVGQIPEIDPEVKEAVLLHHERMDGSGYPFSYVRSSIGLYARIVAIADVFDAMTSDRVYKKGVKPEEAFRMFKTTGSDLFDGRIVEVFLKNITYLFPKKQL